MPKHRAMNRSVSPIFVATLALAGCAAPSKPSDAERFELGAQGGVLALELRDPLT